MYPVAGDWVFRHDPAAATIQHVLPHRSAFIRKAAGSGCAAQVVAANVEVALPTGPNPEPVQAVIGGGTLDREGCAAIPSCNGSSPATPARIT